MSAALRRLLLICALIALGAAALAGCGSSSKPAYCSDKAALKKSINQLKGVGIGKSTLSDVQSNLKTVQQDAKTLVNSAKQSFGPQTQALETAVSSLGTAVRTATTSPSGQSLATVAAGVSSVKSAFTDLSNAVGSKC